MMREVYLDNSATTKPRPEVVQAVVEAMEDHYGNPSSLHRKGVEASRTVTRAREAVAASLGVAPEEIVFTGGGSEGINLAIKGPRPGKWGRHVIATAVEHAAVLHSCQQLEQRGVEVTLLPVDKTGRVDPEQLRDALREDTYLVAVMHVNNEVGAVQPLAQIAGVLEEARRARSGRRLLWHVDAVQGYGKIPLRPAELGVDLLSISGHKVHGPKGVGALYVAPHTPLEPLVVGGGHEFGLRAGTENVPGIAGLGVAARLIMQEGRQAAEKMRRLKDRLVAGIMAAVPGAVFNGPDCYAGGADVSHCAPQIVNISFPGLPGEVLVHSLEQRGIYVATGAACSSGKQAGSHVLQAMGLEKKVVDSALRFSLAVTTTEADIDYAVAGITGVVEELRGLYGSPQ